MKNRNKKSRGRTVLNQHLKDIITEKTYSNEDSPHWDWASAHSFRTEDDKETEHVRANPDSLPELDGDYDERQTTQRDLFESVKGHLTDRETEVFNLLIAGSNQTEIAVALGITQPSVNKTIRRIRTKFVLEGYKNGDNAR